jgi:hypothetical protein
MCVKGSNGARTNSDVARSTFWELGRVSAVEAAAAMAKLINNP